MFSYMPGSCDDGISHVSAAFSAPCTKCKIKDAVHTIVKRQNRAIRRGIAFSGARNSRQ